MAKPVENPLDLIDFEENMNALMDTAAGNSDIGGQMDGNKYYFAWFLLGCIWWITGCGGIYLWISQDIYLHKTWALIMFIIWMLIHVAGFILLIMRRNKGIR